MVVVLPAPLGPRYPTQTPGSMVKFRSFSASNWPNCLLKFSVTMASVMLRICLGPGLKFAVSWCLTLKMLVPFLELFRNVGVKDVISFSVASVLRGNITSGAATSPFSIRRGVSLEQTVSIQLQPPVFLRQQELCRK